MFVKTQATAPAFYFYRMLHLYFVALIVPEPYRQLIDEIRKEIALRFHCSHALKTIPHITLQPPFKSRLKAGEILSTLEMLNEIKNSLLVSTIGFGSFDERVAFIDVQNTGPLKYLQQRVNRLLYEKKMVPLNKHPFHPHITLAHRDLNPEYLPQIKHLVEQKEMIWNFEVNAVTLLMHQNSFWQPSGSVVFG